MTVDTIMGYVSTVGFPIVMCFYLMFKFEKALRDNTNSNRELKALIEKLIK